MYVIYLFSIVKSLTVTLQSVQYTVVTDLFANFYSVSPNLIAWTSLINLAIVAIFLFPAVVVIKQIGLREAEKVVLIIIGLLLIVESPPYYIARASKVIDRSKSPLDFAYASANHIPELKLGVSVTQSTACIQTLSHMTKPRLLRF